MTQPSLAGMPPEVAKTYRLPCYRVQIVREGSVQAEDKHADSPGAIVAILRPMFEGMDREQFVVVMLNARSVVIGLNVVSIGTLTASLVHPRETFKAALIAGAAAIIIAHNHPSGDVTPSAEDKDATRRLVRAGELLGVPVLDHVIMGDSKHFSFKEAGLI